MPLKIKLNDEIDLKSSSWWNHTRACVRRVPYEDRESRMFIQPIVHIIKGHNMDLTDTLLKVYMQEALYINLEGIDVLIEEYINDIACTLSIKKALN